MTKKGNRNTINSGGRRLYSTHWFLNFLRSHGFKGEFSWMSWTVFETTAAGSGEEILQKCSFSLFGVKFWRPSGISPTTPIPRRVFHVFVSGVSEFREVFTFFVSHTGFAFFRKIRNFVFCCCLPVTSSGKFFHSCNAACNGARTPSWRRRPQQCRILSPFRSYIWNNRKTN